jgi:hypothetical protein
VLLTNQNNTNNEIFIEKLREQSFKNIRTVYGEGELLTKDKLLEVCKDTVDSKFSSLIINHSNYSLSDNLIFERICTSFTVLRQLQKDNELILFTKEPSNNFLKMDCYIPYHIALELIEKDNENCSIEELITSVKINNFETPIFLNGIFALIGSIPVALTTSASVNIRFVMA